MYMHKSLILELKNIRKIKNFMYKKCNKHMIFKIILPVAFSYLIFHGADSAPVLVVSDISRRFILNETTGRRPYDGANV